MTGLLRLNLSLFFLLVFSCSKKEIENKTISKEIKKEKKLLQFYFGFFFDSDTTKDLKMYYNDSIFYYNNSTVLRNEDNWKGRVVGGGWEDIYLRGKRVENYELKKNLIEKFKYLAKIVDTDKLVNIDWHSKNNQLHKTDLSVGNFTIKKIGDSFYYIKESKKEFICKESKIVSFNSLDIDDDDKPELFVFKTEVNPKYDFLETSCSIYKID